MSSSTSSEADSVSTPSVGGLRQVALRGGVYLLVRQGIGVVMSVVGTLLLTRTIGPAAYGLFATGLSVFAYLLSVSQWGVGTFLVRKEGEVDTTTYDQAFTLLAILSTAGLLLGNGLALLLGRWISIPAATTMMLALIASLPVVMLAQVPLAIIERALNYRTVAAIELTGQVAYYCVGIGLALRGWGAWAPVIGWWMQQIITLVWLFKATRYRPRLCWEAARVRAMVGYGLGYSASIWVWQLRTLVNPILVGRYVGIEGVGYVALAIRLVEILSFVKSATWRLALAALGRIQYDPARLRTAMTEGMRLQVLALGPLLVTFAVIAPYIVPLVFGPRWLPVMIVYPFVAMSYLVNATFNLHSSGLYVLRRNWAVTIFHVVHVTLLLTTAGVLLPKIGLVAYGWAEATALLGYVIIDRAVVRHVGRPDFRVAGVWALAFIGALFVHQVGLIAGAGLVAVAVWPETTRVLREYIRTVQGYRNA